MTHFSNFWFPWLVMVGGQVPCALAWALVTARLGREPEAYPKTAVISTPSKSQAEALPVVTAAIELPDAPDYELIHPPFGEGAYGKVWLARNAVGQWRYLNAIILKACDPQLSQRYASAGEMQRDLLIAQAALESDARTQPE